MKDKMTSGEIAKKAGISQKAIRLYDEKGLLKPSDYSEGNYRLYDNESLLVLEKIIALKQIGFSLEEIRDNLVGNKNTDILATLQEQIAMMEAKRYELERAITRMQAVIARSNGEPDWDDVADILKSMQSDQNSDDGHFFALDHTKEELDWYVKIFRSLQVEEGERVLDLGCGFSKVWRNNWEDIPENVHIDAYDVRGSWADDFEKYIDENKGQLAEGSEINLHFADLEEEQTWVEIHSNAKYSMILAHYLTYELKDAEALIARASGMLEDGGVMSLNAYGNIQTSRLKWWIKSLEELGIDTEALERELSDCCEKKDACTAILQKYFTQIDEIVIPCTFTYDKVDDLLKDLEKCLPNHKSFLENSESKIRQGLEKLLSEGSVKVLHDEGFWRLKMPTTIFSDNDSLVLQRFLR